MESSKKSPIFIVGSNRSGTTLLRLILTSNPEIHILHETGFLHTFRERSDSYGSFTEERQRWFFIRDLQNHRATTETYSFSSFELSDREAESALAEAAPLDFTEAARVLFEASASKHGATRWGDKTPKYVFHVSWLGEAYPDAQFLHIIRDGRDVAASMRRAGWKKNIRSAAQTWKQMTEAGREAGRALPPERYKEIRYERLVTAPEQTLRELCDWLSMPYTRSMTSSFYEESDSHLPDAHEGLYEKTHQPIDSSRAQAWKSSLPRRKVADVEDVAGNLLKELNYNVTGARIPLWLRSLRVAKRGVLPIARSVYKKLRRLGIA